LCKACGPKGRCSVVPLSASLLTRRGASLFSFSHAPHPFNGPGNDRLVGGTNHEDGHDKSENYLLGKMGDDELIGDLGNDVLWGLSVRRVAVNRL
jgi:hypothetical protein